MIRPFRPRQQTPPTRPRPRPRLSRTFRKRNKNGRKTEGLVPRDMEQSRHPARSATLCLFLLTRVNSLICWLRLTKYANFRLSPRRFLRSSSVKEKFVILKCWRRERFLRFEPLCRSAITEGSSGNSGFRTGHSSLFPSHYLRPRSVAWAGDRKYHFAARRTICWP